MKSIICAVLFSFSLAFGALFFGAPAYADTGNIYLSPSSSSVQIGSSIAVSLRISPGTAVNAAQATVNYNPADLQFASSNPSAFPTCVQNTGGSGTVTVACTILGGSVSSDSLISTITFTALAGSGSDNLTISGANAAEDGSYTNPSSNGDTISFTTPSAPPTQSSSNSSSSSSTKSSTSTAKSTPAVTTTTTASTTPAASTPNPVASVTPSPKVIIASKVTSDQFNIFDVHVSTNTPVECYVSYGMSKNGLLLSTTPTSASTSNTVGLDSNELTPGTTYYYQVVTKDSNGNLTKGPVQSFTTKGYTLRVTVLDSSYKPLDNQEVTLHSTPTYAKTNSDGVATFYNVSPGVHHVDYSPPNAQSVSQEVYVNNSFTTKGTVETAPPQTASVVLTGFKIHTQSKFMPILITVLLIVLIIELWSLVEFLSPPESRFRLLSRYFNLRTVKHLYEDTHGTI